MNQFASNPYEDIIHSDKVRIVANPIKKSFKVWLDSNNTSSYSGKQFDANFTVDLNQCVREPWRLNASYAMTFEFISKASTFAIGTVTTTNVYTVHIDLGKGTSSMYRYAGQRTPAGIVRVSTDGTPVWTVTAGVADVPCYFNSRPTDNDPVFIENIRDITNININLIQAGSGTFNNADGATINNATKYMCCLSFQEL